MYRSVYIPFDRGDGTLAIMETGFRPAEEISKYAVGYWRYTPRFDDLVDADALGNPVRRVNRGAYFFAEQSVYREKDDPSQGLALFFRYGVANGDVNTLDYSSSLSDLGFFGREFGMASNILRHCDTTYPTLLEKLRQHCELIPTAPRSNP